MDALLLGDGRYSSATAREARVFLRYMCTHDDLGREGEQRVEVLSHRVGGAAPRALLSIRLQRLTVADNSPIRLAQREGVAAERHHLIRKRTCFRVRSRPITVHHS